MDAIRCEKSAVMHRRQQIIGRITWKAADSQFKAAYTRLSKLEKKKMGGELFPKENRRVEGCDS